MIEQFPNLHGRTAVIVPHTITGQIMAFFVNKVSIRLRTQLERRVFHEVETAIHWLKELVPDGC